MTTQSEQVLEDNLIKQLQSLGYAYVEVNDEASLLVNLQSQLEAHNQTQFSQDEFKQILHYINKGDVFQRSQILRDKVPYTREDGSTAYIELLNLDHWCQNRFQVANQIKMIGRYKTRYDVTLLINGLPLVQIELKKRGLEMKEAYNQILRYHKHSFSGGQYALFQFLQLFVISNGVNTKYFANNPSQDAQRKQSFKQTFFWADEENKIISDLEDFAQAFLEPCHLSKMICRYTVLHQSRKILMVLRPYQYYAVEAIIDRVKNSPKNGYIWHTTGSGKTLTSFKASQVLITLPQVHKVVFVVDRRDLDNQTTKEFNNFVEGSVDGTDNTKNLVGQFTDTYKDKTGRPKITKLIITTIQKLNTAISKTRFLDKMKALQNERIIFIFDECHRSQFGATHQRITQFFKNSQLFGFTGTPIFAENAIKNELGKRTTKELFEDCLHKYVITDAIRDQNVLKFSVEYVGRYREKEGSRNDIDIEVEAIDTRELMESRQRLEKIVDYIIAHHGRKTHNKDFTAMFCVSGVEMLIRYYEVFKAKKEAGEHNLRVATIFSYTANEDERDLEGFIPDSDFDMSTGTKLNKHSRDKLEEYIGDYNAMYGSNYSTKDSQSFYNYYNNIAKRVKEKDIDLLLVVNMFLTGFDSPYLNTLFVDKNLRYHGLIQAYSRTNRIKSEKKSQGNIVAFRNLKSATDKAITLFSNKEAIDEIIKEPYEDIVEKFKRAFERLKAITPTVDSVNELPSEDEEFEFVQKFRDLIRLKNELSSFADFNFEDLGMEEQEFEDYKSKYLDIYDKVRSERQKEKVSILDDVDFELELIHRDNINVAYILQLLAKLKEAKKEEQEKRKKEIIDLLGSEVQLRSKKELVEKFIQKNMPNIQDSDDIPAEFEAFWQIEQQIAFKAICEEESLVSDKVEEVVKEYLFTNREPQRDDIIQALIEKPKILERKKKAQRIIERLLNFVETFVSGVGEG